MMSLLYNPIVYIFCLLFEPIENFLGTFVYFLLIIFHIFDLHPYHFYFYFLFIRIFDKFMLK